MPNEKNSKIEDGKVLDVSGDTHGSITHISDDLEQGINTSSGEKSVSSTRTPKSNNRILGKPKIKQQTSNNKVNSKLSIPSIKSIPKSNNSKIVNPWKCPKCGRINPECFMNCRGCSHDK